MKTTKKLLLGTILFPLLTLAADVGPQTGIRSLADIYQKVVGLVNWAIGIFFVGAILSLFYAAFLYLTAGGDSTKIEPAKNQLIYSIIAITIALLAGSIRYIVENFLQ